MHRSRRRDAQQAELRSWPLGPAPRQQGRAGLEQVFTRPSASWRLGFGRAGVRGVPVLKG